MQTPAERRLVTMLDDHAGDHVAAGASAESSKTARIAGIEAGRSRTSEVPMRRGWRRPELCHQHS